MATQDINVTFCRLMLKDIMGRVRAHTTPAQRKAAWVIRLDRRQWAFTGPDGYYWESRADNAYDARYQGWKNWLREQGHEE